MSCDDQAGSSKIAILAKFLRLLPISPLSTGLLPKISLPRLGSEVHGAHVIGTEVPASPEGRQRQQGAAGDGRTDLRRQAIGKSFRVLAGASREEAPEEVIASRATRLSGFFGTSASKAGRKSGYPKKGRGTSGSFGPEKLPVFGQGISGVPGRASRTTSEPSGHVVG